MLTILPVPKGCNPYGENMRLFGYTGCLHVVRMIILEDMIVCEHDIEEYESKTYDLDEMGLAMQEIEELLSSLVLEHGFLRILDEDGFVQRIITSAA